MKEYQDFVQQVAADIEERIEGVKAFGKLICKLQGPYFGLVIQPDMGEVSMCLNLESMFLDVWLLQVKSYDEELDELVDIVKSQLERLPKVNTSEMEDYELMKEKLMVQLVPLAGNERMLDGVPHVVHEDMALVYRFMIGSSGAQMSSTLVTNAMLESYGITAEQLHADAMRIAPKKYPATLETMQEVLAGLYGIAPEEIPDAPMGLYVATCNDRSYGAACIFYPGFLEDAAEKLGGDFFILPSSIHEVILLPDAGSGMTVEEMEKMVREINFTEVEPREKLSDTVYHYDAVDDVFEKASTFERVRRFRKNGLGGKLLW